MGSNPIHPGEHLAEILGELKISGSGLARAIGIPPRRIHDILRGRRPVTADTALRIGQACELAFIGSGKGASAGPMRHCRRNRRPFVAVVADVTRFSPPPLAA